MHIKGDRARERKGCEPRSGSQPLGFWWWFCPVVRFFHFFFLVSVYLLNILLKITIILFILYY